jgi:Mg-chelatase subunit ChlI
LTAAREIRPNVTLTDATIEAAARLCVALEVDGHRGELTLCRTAVALAALDGRTATTVDDIAQIATLALQHRLRKDPLENIGDDERVKRAVAELLRPPAPAHSPLPVPDSQATVAEPATPEPPADPQPVAKSAPAVEPELEPPAADPRAEAPAEAVATTPVAEHPVAESPSEPDEAIDDSFLADKLDEIWPEDD